MFSTLIFSNNVVFSSMISNIFSTKIVLLWYAIGHKRKSIFYLTSQFSIENIKWSPYALWLKRFFSLPNLRHTHGSRWSPCSPPCRSPRSPGRTLSISTKLVLRSWDLPLSFGMGLQWQHFREIISTRADLWGRIPIFCLNSWCLDMKSPKCNKVITKRLGLFIVKYW